MLDVAAILVAVILLVLLTWLRGVSALVIPRMRVRPADLPQPPEAFADLFDQADAQLRALGFSRSQWFELEPHAGGGTAINYARWYRHDSMPLMATVMAPVEVSQANRPILALTSMLDDGGTLATFAYSPATAFFSSARHRRRSVPARDAAALWEAHTRWRLEFAQPDAPLPDDEAQLAQDSERRYAELLDDLVADRVLRADREGQLRLRLTAMVRALVRLIGAPKPPPGAAAIPPTRQLAMLPVFERMRLRAPTLSMQWLGFAGSALLFALLGAIVWDMRFAAILLAVLIVHEGGHFLAMRALGYRNVQMVLLPLLGGVTTCVERDANGLHRAIVSLAGPIPGIAIGWALYLLHVRGLLPFADSAVGGVPLTVIVFLTLNYLNLLPIPPLDGSHFLQSLLPRNGLRVGVVVIGFASLVGIALAAWLQSVILGVLAGLQLAGLRGLWRDASMARALRAEFARSGPQKRDARILERVTEQAPQDLLTRRLARVLRLRTLIDLTPPRAVARLLLVALYLASFVLPLALLPLPLPLLHRTGWFGEFRSRPVDPLAVYRQHAASRTIPELVEGIALAQHEVRDAVETPLPSAAPDSADIDAAKKRLGKSLPAAYRELLSAPRHAELGLLPLAQVKRADETLSEALKPFTVDGTIVVQSAMRPDYSEERLAPEFVEGLWLIAGESLDMAVLYDADGSDPRYACCRVVVFEDGDAAGYPTLHDWLVSGYAKQQYYAVFSRAQRQRLASAWEASRGWDVRALIAAFDRCQCNMPTWPDVAANPRTPEQIAFAEHRVGALPDQLRTAFGLRNGLSGAGLFPLDEVVVFDIAAREAAPFRAAPFFHLDENGKATSEVPAAIALKGRVLAFGGYRPVAMGGGIGRSVMMLAIEDEGRWHYLDLQYRAYYDDLRDLLRKRYALLRSMQPVEH